MSGGSSGIRFVQHQILLRQILSPRSVSHDCLLQVLPSGRALFHSSNDFPYFIFFFAFRPSISAGSELWEGISKAWLSASTPVIYLVLKIP